jgi:trimethylamine--corrinoid protein Co-methyltransferase
MSVGQISILSKEDMELVHGETLRILEKPGITVQSDSALKVLEEGGAVVDRRAKRASLPEALVNETVRRMPKRIRLCSRDGRHDMEAPRIGPPFMATNGTAVYMTDLATGERRPTMGNDLRDFMVVADAMESLDYVWPIVTAHDGPEDAHGLNELAISLKSTTKHVQGEAMSAQEAKDMVKVGAAVCGGEDALAKRPVFSVIQCPICPLEFEKGSVEAVMEFAKAGVPVVSMSMAICGLTSPVTLASTVAIVNAENLASFAISQMTKAGAPVVYSSESSMMNMMTGEIRYGAMEQALIAAAVSQMAKRYGAPTMVGSFGVGLWGDRPGISLDPGELAFTMMTNLTMTDYASGLGGLDQAKGAALEQVVIDSDVWESVRDVRREVQFDASHFVRDVIEEVGPGGTFLKHPHTLRAMRKELHVPSPEKLRLHSMYRLDADRGKMVDQARERVRHILDTHVPEQIDPDSRATIDAIVSSHRG